MTTLEEVLEKRLYVYRKSYNYYHKLGIALSLNKFLFSAAGLSALLMVPLAAISIGAGVIEIVDKALGISERKQEYKMGFKFYKELLNLYRAKEITESEVYIKEKDFTSNLQYFPREKYIKKMKLNGYKIN